MIAQSSLELMGLASACSSSKVLPSPMVTFVKMLVAFPRENLKNQKSNRPMKRKWTPLQLTSADVQLHEPVTSDQVTTHNNATKSDFSF